MAPPGAFTSSQVLPMSVDSSCSPWSVVAHRVGTGLTWVTGLSWSACMDCTGRASKRLWLTPDGAVVGLGIGRSRGATFGDRVACNAVAAYSPNPPMIAAMIPRATTKEEP